MRNFITRVTAWSSVAVILSLNFSYAAFAVTTPTKEHDVSSYTDNSPAGPGAEDVFTNTLTVLDSVIESNGDMHIVGLEIDTDFDNDEDLAYMFYDYSGDSWGSYTELATNINTDGTDDDSWTVSAAIALNNSGNPAVVYELVDISNSTTDFHKETHYIQYNGSSWDADRTVDSYTSASTQPTTGTVDFMFEWGTNNPMVFTCNDEDGGLHQYTTTDQFAAAPGANKTETQISSSFCSSVDGITDSNSDIFLAAGDHSSDVVRAYKYQSSSWSNDAPGDGTIMTGMDSQNDSFLKATMIQDGEMAIAVRVDSASAGANDSIAYLERVTGAWSGSETAVNGIELNGDSMIDVTWDSAQTIPYIGFANLNSNEYRVAYDDGTGWTNELVSNSYSPDNAYVTVDFNSQADPDRIEYVMYNGSTSAIELDHWSIGGLATYTEGGGEGVPEFSTYVYLATIMAVFGLLYKKNPEAFAFVANR